MTAAKGYLVAAAIFVVDQLVKLWIIAGIGLQAKGSINLLPVLSLTWVENRGVSMGLLQADGAKERWILTGVTALIAAGVAWWMRKETNRIDILALALVLGGALGNIVDRVRFGYVVDFVHVHVGEWSFYVFNVADAAITIGVAILLLRAFFERKPAAAE
ncbi:signal peptidase II [Sphingosinicella microcystinivorans]|uniref:Lipoprotein signal peptidase n=1 Tax=Sphingosinicella microcystinivorans TaxID=335406 RepID=A0AAD1FZU4_SPHMI|nr:signal peptidase II [Sphingosinicella microcystinivorans]RKS89178.1 signal peptidase II [Sphingosinicella microcystinivorans]BBE32935.1 lipoprotein signal peptidase [Sphingosinicella microcystinivorans]